MSDLSIRSASKAIQDAQALLITAGAGMGVDSGLPDFRGNEGFWKAYPPFKARGLSFIDAASPTWFRHNPSQGWGFYGHRLHLYRTTIPHKGFDILHRIAQRMSAGAFVVTSNVDGQFQRAGFLEDMVVELHGSIHHLQCTTPCHNAIWSADKVHLTVNETTFLASDPLPRCPACSGIARPNVLMFGDSGWIQDRTAEQEQRFLKWIRGIGDARLVVVELGAGTAIPSVRMTSERWARRNSGTLVRVNLDEPQVPHGHIGIAGPALATLKQIALLTHDNA
jgi:NAD-dependent SIR2 family protein deacetylase